MQFAVKKLSRSTTKLTEKDRGRLQKQVRDLKGCPRSINHYEYQKAVENIVVWIVTPTSRDAGRVERVQLEECYRMGPTS